MCVCALWGILIGIRLEELTVLIRGINSCSLKIRNSNILLWQEFLHITEGLNAFNEAEAEIHNT